MARGKVNIGRVGAGGFSLVELSVVITIISISLAGALDLATTATTSQKITETNARMDAIEQALRIFVINNQRLPCPADNYSAFNNNTYGIEATPTAGGCTGTNYGITTGLNTIYGGGVPTKTLGLDDKYMSDSWNRRFTYVVDDQFVNSITTNTLCDGGTGDYHTKCFKQTTAGTVVIQTTSGGTQIASNAVYVIISHGPNGNGAWTYSSGVARLAASSDADEQNNAGDDAGLFDGKFIQKDATSTFDDIARYSTKSGITEAIGGNSSQFTSSTCITASDAYNNAEYGTRGVVNATYPADPCPLAANSTTCYKLATKTYNLCLTP
jgi:hypothetical protein